MLPKDPSKIEAYLKQKSESAKGNKNCLGRVVSEETRKKIGKAHKGKKISDNQKELLRKAHTGKKLTEEHKKKIGEAGKGRKLSEITKERIRQTLLGVPRPKEVVEKMSNSLKGRKLSEEHIQKLSGENAHSWKGGISFEPYCPKFNNEFKERVRAFFNYQCAECGTPQNGKKLGVHHVNFNKKTCCDNSIPLFVPLCNSCHGKTGQNRDYWQQHFTEMIEQYYGGRCYFMKNEITQIKPVLAGGD